MNIKRLSAALLGMGMLFLAGLAPADTFERHPKQFRVGPSVTAIVSADLNGDSLPEIITADRGRLGDPREERPAHNQLSYLVAKEKLRYEGQPQLRGGFGPYAVAVANIDALKAPDIVVANFIASRNRDMTLLRNIGNDLFEPVHFSVADEKLTYTKMRDGDNFPLFTTPGMTSLAVADVNGDGYRDVIATGWSSDVLVLFPGAAKGYFGEPKVIDAPGGPRDVAIHDFDGDGALDLAVTMYTSSEITLWRGDGKGGFTETVRFLSRGRLPHKIALADMNADRKKDIVVSHCHADDSVVIFYRNDGFQFDVSQEYMLDDDRRKLKYEIRDLVADDFNGDGRTDLALACYAAKEVVVLINKSTSTSLPQRFSRETYAYKNGNPRALCVSDFNLDDKPDLGVALWQANAVSLLLGK